MNEMRTGDTMAILNTVNLLAIKKFLKASCHYDPMTSTIKGELYSPFVVWWVAAQEREEAEATAEGGDIPPMKAPPGTVDFFAAFPTALALTFPKVTITRLRQEDGRAGGPWAYKGLALNDAEPEDY